MLTLLIKLLKALNSEQSPSQLAAGLCFAMVMGMTPLLSLHNLIALFLVLFFRVNLTLLLISFPLFVFIGFILQPIYESIGLAILQLSALQPIWQSFFNTVVGRWSEFYYANMMGSFVFAVVFALLLYPVFKHLVVKYRKTWLDKINQFKVVRSLKASKLWQMYSSVTE